MCATFPARAQERDSGSEGSGSHVPNSETDRHLDSEREWYASSSFEHIRVVADQLLGDRDRVSSMSPVGFIDWACALPKWGLPCNLREDTFGAIEIVCVSAIVIMPYLRVCSQVAAREERPRWRWQRDCEYWEARKRELDWQWRREYFALPEHVKQVLGKGENVCLFEEMLIASGAVDQI